MSFLKRVGAVACMLMAVCSLVLLVGCDKQASEPEKKDIPSSEITKVTIGTMPTEDFLPMWVAQHDKLFEQKGLNVEIKVFQSAKDLASAMAAGEIDGAMTDVPVAATLTNSGKPMTAAWITCGATASEGRFGILVGPKSSAQSLADLADKKVGVGSATMPEYVMDKLFEEAGVSADHVVKEEVKSVPDRFKLVMEGQIDGASLPATLLALGEKTGGRVIKDDTQGANLSQSIMVFSSDFMKKDGAVNLVKQVGEVWNEAANKIDQDKDGARAVLLENIKLPDPLKADYPIQHYPQVELPKAAEVAPLFDWMLAKHYIDTAVSYDEKTGAFTK